MTFPTNPADTETYTIYGRTFVFSSSANAWRNFKSGDFVEVSAAQINQSNTISNINISSFKDVEITNPQTNDILVYNANSGAFLNQNSVTLASATITNLSFPKLTEMVNVTASAPSATTNIDLLTASIHYYNVNMTSNITLNIRGDSTTTLNSMIIAGQSLTCTLIVQNGSAQYYPNSIKVDNTTVTVKWQTSAPTNGNQNKTDVYTFSIIKTADATFTVLGSQADFS